MKKSPDDAVRDDDRVAIGQRIGEMVSQFRTKIAAAQCAEVSVEQLSRVIAATSVPTVLPIARLAKATGYNLDWVLTGRGSRLISAPQWSSVDDIGAAPDLQAAGAALESAAVATHGGARVVALGSYLQHALAPRLVKLYRGKGTPLSERELQELLLQAAVFLGIGEPDAPKFHPEPHWPLVVEIIVSTHTQALNRIATAG